VMASSVKLEFPFNDNLPSLQSARDRLLAKIFKYRKDKRKSASLKDEDFALLYAFSEPRRQSSPFDDSADQS
jgi:hypothetical protein